MHSLIHNSAVLEIAIMTDRAVDVQHERAATNSALGVTCPCADRSSWLFVARDIKCGTK